MPTPKYDFDKRLTDANAQLERAQGYRDAAGRAQKTAAETSAQAQKTAEQAQQPVPWAASLEASNAKGISQSLAKAQDRTPGSPPALSRST